MLICILRIIIQLRFFRSNTKVAKNSTDFEMVVTYYSLLAKYYSNIGDDKNAELNYAFVIKN